jgi:hypothetical protein
LPCFRSATHAAIDDEGFYRGSRTTGSESIAMMRMVG